MLRFTPGTDAHVFKVNRYTDQAHHVTIGEVVRQPGNKAVFIAVPGYALHLEEVLNIGAFMSRPARCIFQKACDYRACPNKGTCKEEA